MFDNNSKGSFQVINFGCFFSLIRFRPKHFGMSVDDCFVAVDVFLCKLTTLLSIQFLFLAFQTNARDIYIYVCIKIYIICQGHSQLTFYFFSGETNQSENSTQILCND